MTDLLGRGRRRYAHRASRRREPVFAIAAGVLLVALCIPVAWRALSDRSDHGSGPKQSATTQSSGPRTSGPQTSAPSSSTGSSTSPATTLQPGTTPIPQTEPGVVIHVVPAVRDVQVMVDQTLYTTTSDGIINAPSARGMIPVSYVGYSVIPALQEVSFRYWSDGLTSPTRTVDADGRGHLSLAVDLRYRVTVTITGGATSPKRTLTATSPVGSVQFTDGERRWVLAVRGELSGTAVVERNVTYSFDPPQGAPATQRQEFTAGPEALWTVRAP